MTVSSNKFTKNQSTAIESTRSFEKMALAMQRYASDQRNSIESTKGTTLRKTVNTDQMKNDNFHDYILTDPHLGAYKEINEKRKNDLLSKSLVTLNDNTSESSESFRTLRSELLLRWFSKNQKSLTIVSAEKNDGRSYLASNLAIVFAQLGKRTLLIDADLRSPKQHLLFDIPGDQGLSAVLKEDVPNCTPHRISALPKLSVIVAGPRPLNPQDMLAQPRLSQLFRQVQEHYEIVIVDTPPAAVFGDAGLVAAKTGGALLLTRTNNTKYQSIQVVKERLLINKVKIVGCVLNDQ